LMSIALLFIEEPQRRFATDTKTVSAQAHDTTGSRTTLDSKVWWCLLVICTTSLSVAAWETSAAVVTQTYFGWSVSVCSLFMGGLFLFSSLSGEGLRALLRSCSIVEADVVVLGLACAVGGSALLYWYLPSKARDSLVSMNETAYAVGSCLVLFAANSARSYATSIAMRVANSQSSRAKELANVGQAAAMMLGRSAGALGGMGVATLPGGAEGGAGLVTVASVLALLFLMVPQLLSDLRHA